jgi:hypothetical protein
MKTRKLILALLATAVLATAAFADSPITSTHFAEAYQDEPIVVATVQYADGVLNSRLNEYLVSEYNPIDVKMAVINALGWQIKGRDNARTFLDYLIKSRGYSDANKFFKKGRADELLSYAYLKAMDNYFEVDEALKFAEQAVKKDKSGSRTIRLIAGLIKAQKAMDSSFCEVFRITDGIRKNERLMNDMRTKAVNIIYEYMDIYGDSC